MGRSIRFPIRGVHGRHRHNFNWPGVIKSRQAVVHITAAEIKPSGTSQVLGPNGVTEQTYMYWLGDANIWISNVSPHFNDHFDGEPGGVEFIVNVDWGSPIDVAVTITVEDQTPVEVQN